MSAECHKCGFDLVYPEGTWPLGECLNCKQSERIESQERELARLRAELERLERERDDLRETLARVRPDIYPETSKIRRAERWRE